MVEDRKRYMYAGATDSWVAGWFRSVARRWREGDRRVPGWCRRQRQQLVSPYSRVDSVRRRSVDIHMTDGWLVVEKTAAQQRHKKKAVLPQLTEGGRKKSSPAPANLVQVAVVAVGDCPGLPQRGLQLALHRPDVLGVRRLLPAVELGADIPDDDRHLPLGRLAELVSVRVEDGGRGRRRRQVRSDHGSPGPSPRLQQSLVCSAAAAVAARAARAARPVPFAACGWKKTDSEERRVGECEANETVNFGRERERRTLDKTHKSKGGTPPSLPILERRTKKHPPARSIDKSDKRRSNVLKNERSTMHLLEICGPRCLRGSCVVNAVRFNINMTQRSSAGWCGVQNVLSLMSTNCKTAVLPRGCSPKVERPLVLSCCYPSSSLQVKPTVRRAARVLDGKCLQRASVWLAQRLYPETSRFS